MQIIFVWALMGIVLAIYNFGFDTVFGIFFIIIAIIIAIIFLFWIGTKLKEEENRRKEKERRKQQEEERRKQREKEEEERRKREEQERIERHKQEQNQIYKDIIDLVDTSINCFESLPKYLRNAERNLNQAKKDFSENAITPFWESIERAYQHIGKFNDAVCKIESKLSKYKKLVNQYEGKPPIFPISKDSIQKLDTSNLILKRANYMVRQAQKVTHFAYIFEMRRQNKILIAGFNNLSDTINKMGQKLESSIDVLQRSIDSVNLNFDEFQNTVEAQTKEIQNQTEEIKSSDENMEKFLREEAERKERERQALNQLDEIHHIERKKYYGY